MVIYCDLSRPGEFFDCVSDAKRGSPATFQTANNHDKVTGMAASPYVKALDDIQRALTGFLKPLGFKKKGRTYNRHVSDGLVQVVNLQMGQFPIGDYVIPGLRESHYGRFTVNLGVALPAVRAIESGGEFPVFVQEYVCDIRQRLTRLAFNEDAWFDLDHQVSKTASDITRYMDSLGLPFLEEFESYDNVLAVLDKSGSLPFSNEGRSFLVGAMLCVHLKQLERARNYFDRAASYATTNKGFAGHVAEVRRKCGLCKSKGS